MCLYHSLPFGGDMKGVSLIYSTICSREFAGLFSKNQYLGWKQMVSLEWKHSCAIHLRGQTVLPQEIRLEIGLCSAVWSQYIEMSNRLCEKLLILEVKNSLFLKHGLPIPSSCKRLLKAFFLHPCTGSWETHLLKNKQTKETTKDEQPLWIHSCVASEWCCCVSPEFCYWCDGWCGLL